MNNCIDCGQETKGLICEICTEARRDGRFANPNEICCDHCNGEGCDLCAPPACPVCDNRWGPCPCDLDADANTHGK